MLWGVMRSSLAVGRTAALAFVLLASTCRETKGIAHSHAPSNRSLSLTRTFLNQNDFRFHGCRVAMERPTKTGDMAVEPTTPAEQGYIHFYSSVVQINESDFRLYYFSKGADGYHSHVAVAPTPVGPWSKPHLGLFEVDGSTANNVIAVGSTLVSVFLDDAPGVPVDERIKAVDGTEVLISSDGFKFLSQSPPVHVGWKNFADTQPVVMWDAASVQYVASGRVDEPWEAGSL